ncbi:MAG: DUF4345 family protein [Candidatus Binatia bacterium]|nr:DUF4345 family protein [Candidatus Binatia bacterium]
MSGIQIFLLLEALLWVPYGIYCLLVPGVLADGATVTATSATGVTELRAMYGGLQFAIGAGCIWGAVSEDLERSAVWMLFLLTSGIGTARVIGLGLDGGMGAYTSLALVFEFATAIWSGRLLLQEAE